MTTEGSDDLRPRRGEIALAVLALAALTAAYARTLGGPSLWLDEAWEANYYAGYAATPWYNRPILYMTAVRALVRVLGPSELVLRLLPCLAALGAIAATWWLARTGLGRVEAWLSAGLLAVAPPMIGYAHELKNYAFDALCAVLLALAYRGYARGRTTRRLAAWTALAIVSFGVSFSSVLVVAAIGAIEIVTARRERAPILRFAAALATAGLVFVALYLAFHSVGARDPLLAKYFVEAYAPLRAPAALPGWLAHACLDVVREQSGLGSGLAAALLVVGGAFAVVPKPTGRLVVAVLSVTAALGIAASGLALYPFGVERLSLHLAPYVAILVASALAALVREGPSRTARVLAVAAIAYALFSPALRGAVPYVTTGWHREHVRHLVATLDRERAPGDGIFVNDDAMPAFRFYWSRLGHRDEIGAVVNAGRFRREPQRHAEGVAAMAAAHPRFWALLTHMPPEELTELRRLVLERCREQASHVEGDARLDLYVCGGAP